VRDEGFFPRERVTVVGILNLTPDSFSDGGRFVSEGDDVDVAAAVAAGLALVRDGAHVIDVGGESTRPGAARLGPVQETRRTTAVIEALAKVSDVPISIDTRKREVAEAALDAGARIVNDVSGLGHDSGIAELCAERGATLILGHLRGEPAVMQDAPHFEDVLLEVTDELAASMAQARAAGVPEAHLVVDPGIGFGKTAVHNLRLLAGLGQLRRALGRPVLVGTSRKSFLGRLTGDEVEARGTATQAADAIAIFQGADGIRVHDVAAARRTAAVAEALRRARSRLVEVPAT
jgi:dihydropteroate synthase